MKNIYTTPEMEVIAFESEDIITTSTEPDVPVLDPEEAGLPLVDLSK